MVGLNHVKKIAVTYLPTSIIKINEIKCKYVGIFQKCSWRLIRYSLASKDTCCTNLTTSVRFPDLTWCEERISSTKLSSEFHTWAFAYAPTHTHTHILTTIMRMKNKILEKKSISCLTCFLNLYFSPQVLLACSLVFKPPSDFSIWSDRNKIVCAYNPSCSSLMREFFLCPQAFSPCCLENSTFSNRGICGVSAMWEKQIEVIKHQKTTFNQYRGGGRNNGRINRVMSIFAPTTKPRKKT